MVLKKFVCILNEVCLGLQTRLRTAMTAPSASKHCLENQGSVVDSKFSDMAHKV